MRHPVLATLAAVATLAVLVTAQTPKFSNRVTDQLSLLYEFDEQVGTFVNDLSPFAAKGANWNTTINGCVNWLSGTASPEPHGIEITGTGCTSTAPVFNPILGSVTSLIPYFDSNTGFSVEMWVQANNPGVTDAFLLSAASLLQSSNAACVVGAVSFQIHLTDDQLSFRLNSDTENCQVIGPYTVTEDLMHVVATSPPGSSGSIKVYIDGVRVDGDTDTISSGFDVNWSGDAAERQLAIGAKQAGEFPITGKVYLTAMYNKALSPAEVLTNYAGGPYNYVPVVKSETIVAARGVGQSVFLTANDTIDELYLSIVTAPTTGSLYHYNASTGAIGGLIGDATPIDGQYVWYVAPTTSVGAAADSFVYQASDGVEVGTATITVDVEGVIATISPVAVTYGSSAAVSFDVTAFPTTGADYTITLDADAGYFTLDAGALGAITSLDLGDATDDTTVRVTVPRVNLATVAAGTTFVPEDGTASNVYCSASLSTDYKYPVLASAAVTTTSVVPTLSNAPPGTMEYGVTSAINVDLGFFVPCLQTYTLTPYAISGSIVSTPTNLNYDTGTDDIAFTVRPTALGTVQVGFSESGDATSYIDPTSLTFTTVVSPTSILADAVPSVIPLGNSTATLYVTLPVVVPPATTLVVNVGVSGDATVNVNPSPQLVFSGGVTQVGYQLEGVTNGSVTINITIDPSSTCGEFYTAAGFTYDAVVAVIYGIKSVTTDPAYFIPDDGTMTVVLTNTPYPGYSLTLTPTQSGTGSVTFGAPGTFDYNPGQFADSLTVTPVTPGDVTVRFVASGTAANVYNVTQTVVYLSVRNKDDILSVTGPNSVIVSTLSTPLVIELTDYPLVDTLLRVDVIDLNGTTGATFVGLPLWFTNENKTGSFRIQAGPTTGDMELDYVIQSQSINQFDFTYGPVIFPVRDTTATTTSTSSSLTTSTSLTTSSSSSTSSSSTSATTMTTTDEDDGGGGGSGDGGGGNDALGNGPLDALLPTPVGMAGGIAIIAGGGLVVCCLMGCLVFLVCCRASDDDYKPGTGGGFTFDDVDGEKNVGMSIIAAPSDPLDVDEFRIDIEDDSSVPATGGYEAPGGFVDSRPAPQPPANDTGYGNETYDYNAGGAVDTGYHSDGFGGAHSGDGGAYSAGARSDNGAYYGGEAAAGGYGADAGGGYDASGGYDVNGGYDASGQVYDPNAQVQNYAGY